MILNMFRASLCSSSGGQFFIFTVSGIVTLEKMSGLMLLKYGVLIVKIMR
jgi:hypothetical protein